MSKRRRSDAGAAPIIQINQSVLTGGTFTVNAARDDDDDAQRTRGAKRRRGANGSFLIDERPQSLEDIVAFDALLNANERYPAPKCHTDTRMVALEIVRSWIRNRRAGFRRIMWISGAPGVGKSALLQTTCEKLAAEIHASFFFGRGQGRRELAASLPPTIAYQFTVESFICRWHTWYLLRNDPAILCEAFHSQFRKLVMAPASIRSYLQYPMVVVIDGLDECINAQDRVSLLELILEAANTLSIRFIISSRPEQEIETFFKRPDVAQRVDHIILDEESFQTSKDIRILLRSEFARIRESRPDLTFDLVDGVEWPGDSIIDRVTVDSDGQFIFATLFIGYIDEEILSPQEQLDALLNPPGRVAAFSKLDHLYHQILTRRPRHMDENNVKFMQYQECVKGILVAVFAWPEELSVAGIAGVLGEEIHVVQHIVSGPLRTLFRVQGPVTDPKIAFCHKSLGDCLSDPKRSGEFHVPPNTLDPLFHRILSRPPPPDPSQTFSREQLVEVLDVVAAFPGGYRENEIASVLGLDSSTVGRVVAPLMGLLFRKHEKGYVTLVWPTLRDFLADPQRSGEFHVPPNAPDRLFHRILSRPPPSDPSQTFSREQLVDVLRVVFAWPHSPNEEETAAILDFDAGTVGRVLAPFMGLFLKRDKEDDVYIRWKAFEDCLADPQRSGEFHVPPNTLDRLFHRILSRPPPSDPSQTFSREQLVEVLHVVVALPERYTDDRIASILGWDSGTVGRVTAPFMGLLFRRKQNGLVYFRFKAFQNYLADPQRSGEFHVPPNTLDRLFHRILSRPPPPDPSQTFSREQLVEVLHVVVALPGVYTDNQIASVLGWDSGTVGRVVAPFMGLLFRRKQNGPVHFRWKVFKDFLADQQRSGEFHVPPNALDRLFHRILSLPLPSDPSQTFSREQLFGVLCVVFAWSHSPNGEEIASLLGLDSGTVARVVFFMDLLISRTDDDRISFRCTAIQEFLADPQRSGEFHVPPNTLDRLFHRILSRPPPPDPSQTFSREQLVEVLHAVFAFGGGCTDNQIASVLGLDSGTIGRVVAPFMGLFFRRNEKGRLSEWLTPFKDFLTDPQRSGEFHVPPNTLDRLFHRILSRPPPSDPSQTFSREQLVEVLHVVVALPGKYTDDQIASVLGLGGGIVGRVTAPFMGLLFRRNKGGCVDYRWEAFRDFLADPQRSGAFHVPPNALDLCS